MLPSIVLVGRISSEIKLKTFDKHDGSEGAVLNFSIVCNKSVKKGEEWVDEGHFYNCTAWNHTAKYINKARNKGDQLIVSGTLEHKTWESETGEKRSQHIINVSDIEIGRTKGDGKKTDGDDAVMDDDDSF